MGICLAVNRADRRGTTRCRLFIALGQVVLNAVSDDWKYKLKCPPSPRSNVVITTTEDTTKQLPKSSSPPINNPDAHPSLYLKNLNPSQTHHHNQPPKCASPSPPSHSSSRPSLPSPQIKPPQSTTSTSANAAPLTAAATTANATATTHRATGSDTAAGVRGTAALAPACAGPTSGLATIMGVMGGMGVVRGDGMLVVLVVRVLAWMSEIRGGGLGI